MGDNIKIIERITTNLLAEPPIKRGGYEATASHNRAEIALAKASVLRLEEDLYAAKIHWLHVEPDYRQLGIGTAVMRRLLDWARSTPAHYIDATVIGGESEYASELEYIYTKKFGFYVVDHDPENGAPIVRRML